MFGRGPEFSRPGPRQEPEFFCPYSPDPRKPSCIPGQRCAQAAAFATEAMVGGAKTRALAANEKNKGGPWFTRIRWNNRYAHFKNIDCAQNALRKRFVERTHAQKTGSGKLI